MPDANSHLIQPIRARDVGVSHGNFANVDGSQWDTYQDAYSPHAYHGPEGKSCEHVFGVIGDLGLSLCLVCQLPTEDNLRELVMMLIRIQIWKRRAQIPNLQTRMILTSLCSRTVGTWTREMAAFLMFAAPSRTTIMTRRIKGTGNLSNHDNFMHALSWQKGEA
jgi:hypothetical protein